MRQRQRTHQQCHYYLTEGGSCLTNGNFRMSLRTITTTQKVVFHLWANANHQPALFSLLHRLDRFNCLGYLCFTIELSQIYLNEYSNSHSHSHFHSENFSLPWSLVVSKELGSSAPPYYFFSSQWHSVLFTFICFAYEGTRERPIPWPQLSQDALCSVACWAF